MAGLRQLVAPRAPEPVSAAAVTRVARWAAATHALIFVLNACSRWMSPDALARARFDDFLKINLPLQVVGVILCLSIARDGRGLEGAGGRLIADIVNASITVHLGTWLVGGEASNVNLVFALSIVMFVRLYFTARHALIALAAIVISDFVLAGLFAGGYLPEPALGSTTRVGDPLQLTLATPGWRAVGMVMALAAAGYAANRFRTSEAALRKLNDDLEERVRTQVAALERSARLRRYLAPQLVEEVLAAEKDPVAMRERRPMTIMFADLRGFTALVERLAPDALADTLSLYFDEVSRVAFRHGGTIDKFIGDAVMVFFGAPQATGETDQARRCVAMALDVQARLAELAPDFVRLTGAPVEVRIGVASGVATVGGFGAAHRTDFTVVGAPVNRAARLEPLAPPGVVLIDELTRTLAGDAAAFEPAGEFTLRGFEKPVKAFRAARLPAGNP